MIERTKTFEDIKIQLEDEVLDEMLIMLGKKEFIGYFRKSDSNRNLQSKGENLSEESRLERLHDKFRSMEEDDYQETKCYQDSEGPSKAERIKNCYQNNDPFDE